MKNNNATILIVDDVPKNIQILGNILSPHHFKIAYAQSGEQALKAIEYNNFDLILLDIMMPGMDGFEVCEVLKNQNKTREIPIIFLTAKADMESIVRGFEVGGEDYITKPFNAAELLARVETHLLLHEQKKSLKILNENLEEKVRERTIELEEAYKRLDNLEKAKTDFLSIISHELRTPLNGLMGLSSLLHQTQLNSEQKEYMQYLNEVADRLTRFSEIALLITHLKVQKYNAELLSTSVKYMLESVVEEFNAKYPDHTHPLQLNDVQDNLMIAAAPELLTKSLNLLLDNARKYAGPEGKVKLLCDDTKAGWVDILIEDNGPGFRKEALEHVYELFSTGDLSHTEGTGLSLAAIKLIIDVHEGGMLVENINSGGARIKLSFKTTDRQSI
ncbi:MAG: hybrid sensor histidine kinase/response regulator [Bacteroidales bacterium]|nr:hybrid sensor histidine kinase/response regulator [Bacteroidales bacterium]